MIGYVDLHAFGGVLPYNPLRWQRRPQPAIPRRIPRRSEPLGFGVCHLFGPGSEAWLSTTATMEFHQAEIFCISAIHPQACLLSACQCS